MTEAVGAVDIGGTKVLLGLFDAGGTLLATGRSAVGEQAPEDVTSHIAAELEVMARTAGVTVRGIGVSVPGPLRRDSGVILLSPNLGWHDYPLGPRLAALAGMPVSIDDDANLAALGEWWHGRGAGARRFVLVVVGSGVGSGIVIDGALYHGARDSAGEIGHIPVMRSGGAPCGCGRRGCLETVASGSSIARRWGAASAEEVFDAAGDGDSRARTVIIEAADYLGWGLAVVANVLDPDCIVLGGGLGARGGWYLDAVVAAMRMHALPHNVAHLEPGVAALGADAGLHGAGLLALREAGLAAK